VALAALVISFTSVLAIRFVKDYVEVNVWTQIWRQLGAAAAMVIVGWHLNPFMSQGLRHLVAGGVMLGATYILALIALGCNKVKSEIESLW
jgi:Na+-translocating ferredoxin:NAD+ oxidoreductase RnfD subunit